MAESKKVAYDPKKGGKFEPTTKATPPPPPRPGRKDKYPTAQDAFRFLVRQAGHCSGSVRQPRLQA